MRRNICLVISYDGTDYFGFQSQPGGNTVQDKLEEAVRILTGEPHHMLGAGRTDAGVHARGMFVNFHTDSTIPIDRWAVALNTRLPEDIVVHSAREMPDEFNARRHAVRKTYRYAINCCKFPDPFRRRFEFHHPTPLNVGAMQAGLQHLIGEHDFTSFTSPLSTKPHHVRTVYEARLESVALPDDIPTLLEERDRIRFPGKTRGLFHLYVSGNGFLYNMVRIIAGTILQVGEGKRQPDDMAAILAARSRAKAGPTAMAHGLTLWKIEYDEKYTC
ncbi:tRNA pseudouridine(38-40) synthase TruA [Cohnella candidum]|uniref:tRNA pseudouridine synthase A n=1 Tax=Cohnella candidum TaxID=2674991 RepID=A0A3G3K1H7_9BACL|nr:tRNA pseudouridine(38-40) synthase TruA [Cohnella candidum]AYQ74021.1 tRNA pseudouridine(38-40) synthase TruA [Cohnella candidum]